MSSNARAFALPLLGLLVVGGWFVFRPRDEAPATTTTPPAKTEGPGDRERSGVEPSAGRPSDAAAPKPKRPTPPPSTVRDRQRSDAAREALRTRLADTATDDARRQRAEDDDEGAPTGTLNKDYIRDRIQQDLVPIAKECYASALEDEPKLAGKLVMTFGIAGDEEVGGVVDEAAVDPTSEIKHPELGECMRESMMSLSFPAPEDGGRVAVTYPFVFSADGPPPQ